MRLPLPITEHHQLLNALYAPEPGGGNSRFRCRNLGYGAPQTFGRLKSVAEQAGPKVAAIAENHHFVQGQSRFRSERTVGHWEAIDQYTVNSGICSADRTNRTVEAARTF
jgi:hypothetical protein